MDTRREFLRKVAFLAGSAGVAGMFPPSIQRAFAINPDTGTTYLDAEHIVILMQENRSFDHSYGSLQGVRGFNDPRALQLPNGNKVWLQSNAAGETYAPFRLNMIDTKATWMGSLPHGWDNQTDARNEGKHDRWLDVKKSSEPEYRDLPLTMGYYNRDDISFYYSLADAFTVCDQNFCSSLTGTTPNRLHLWTGKIREDADAPARVRNEETDYRVEAAWKTFPERLEENNISWKIYQNELSVGVGFEGEEDPWLANFGDSPIECFTQYNVRFHPAYMKYLPAKIQWLESEIADAGEKAKSMTAGSKELADMNQRLDWARKELAASKEDLTKYTPENYASLPDFEKRIHEKAFVTNQGDNDYHKLATLKYKDGEKEREMKIPAGDLFYQFREDVKNGNLPMVSWLVAPENFSDHPSAPWYGAWYVSETLDILTQNPEVWKKTVFILCYDENDGYFDHVTPFVSPTPDDPKSGKASAGIDLRPEYLTLEADVKRVEPEYARGGPIGLGFRVPLVIASPWSRGGAVCSEVFDHTSIIRFLENFLSHKTGKEIKETNISAWRRTVCGDLSSVFTPYKGEAVSLPKFLPRDQFVERIHKVQFKPVPATFKKLSGDQIKDANSNPESSILPRQEKGTRLSRALPYELYADGRLTADNRFEMDLRAGEDSFGGKTAGSPFQVYSLARNFNARNYAVVAGDQLSDEWHEDDFNAGKYHFRVYGPNGFYREFMGSNADPTVQVKCGYETNGSKTPTGKINLVITNQTANTLVVEVSDNSYGLPAQRKEVPAASQAALAFDTANSFGWYDLSVKVTGLPGYESRYAGRVETGKDSMSDPAMAG